VPELRTAEATDVVLRRGAPGDAEACGRICYEAFREIAESRGFVPDFPSREVATHLVSALLAHDGFYGVVAEHEGRVVGSNFLDERSTIAGIGPITVDPGAQGSGVGRRLMLDVLDRARGGSFPGVRLVQASYNTRSLSLYATLGFEVREPLAVLQGPALDEELPGYTTRPAAEEDLVACDALCRHVHGHDRSGELLDEIRAGRARVVELGGRLTGYTTGVDFFAHSVAETNDGLKALIASSAGFGGPGFLLPARNGELFRWCLDRGLRVVQLMTLMSTGLYNEPQGAFLPSILF
jgi:predicted N-acetyltransferase YhbS